MNIKLIAQSALRIEHNDLIIYFDPFKIDNNYNDADYIFITHSHYDHYSPEDILKVQKENTKIIIPSDLKDKVNLDYMVVEPNKEYTVDNLSFKTIPAYNENKEFHKKEYNWVGYILELDKTIYVAGDTDNTVEARNVSCDIACVPIGGTYTMNVLEAVDLIKSIRPSIAIPIHYQTIVGTIEDAYKFKELLKDTCEVDILMK